MSMCTHKVPSSGPIARLFYKRKHPGTRGLVKAVMPSGSVTREKQLSVGQSAMLFPLMEAAKRPGPAGCPARSCSTEVLRARRAPTSSSPPTTRIKPGRDTFKCQAHRLRIALGKLVLEGRPGDPLAIGNEIVRHGAWGYYIDLRPSDLVLID